MWLRQDERRLLVGYFDKINRINEMEWFDKGGDLSPLLKSSGNEPRDLDLLNRINDANSVLLARGLIEVKDHKDSHRVGVAVTNEGHKWALKYRSWYGLADALYIENRNGLLVSVVLAIVIGVLIRWLT